MVTLSWIVHTRYLLQEPQQFITNLPEVAMPNPVQNTTMKRVTGKGDPDHNLIFENIAAQVIMIPTEAAQGHNTGIDATTIGAAHNDHAPPIDATATDLAMTHHINCVADHPHIEVLQLTNPEIAGDHAHDHPTNGKAGLTQINFTFQQIMWKTTPQEEPKGEN